MINLRFSKNQGISGEGSCLILYGKAKIEFEAETESKNGSFNLEQIEAFEGVDDTARATPTVMFVVSGLSTSRRRI